MIQAHEIKVGNRFIRELHNSHGLEYDHDFILTEEWMGKLFGDNTSIALQDLNHIPLSSSILERCGFKDEPWSKIKIRENTWITLGRTHTSFIPIHVAITHNFTEGFTIQEAAEIQKEQSDFNDQAFIIKGEQTAFIGTVNYLHELQNIFWCLCKQEINYQPK